MSEASQPPEGASAGTLLRTAREAAGLHVATLAANLKVPLRKLEALEADQYEQLGDAVFVRALASSVCRTLKIDPAPVLARLPQTARPRLVAGSDGINEPFRPPGSAPSGGGWLGQVSRPVVLVVLVLLLAALVLIFLPVAQRDGGLAHNNNEPVMPPGTPTVIDPPAESAPAAVPAPEPAAPALAPASAPLALEPAPAVPAATAAAQPPAAAPLATASAPLRPASAIAPAPTASAAVAASGAAAAARGIVTFRARGSSWVQVTDANGTPVLRKLLEAGESAGASGALPLSVTVGSVEQTEVQVRGKPFDLQPLSKDNVARFQVN